MEQKNADDFYTWDLSCHSKQETNSESESEFLDCSVLDLSCKNPMTPTIIGNTRACLSQNLSEHTNNQHQNLDLSNTKKQNPFIVPLASPELDSSRKMAEQYGPSFCNTNSEIKNALPMFIPSPSVAVGVPFLSPSLPLHLNGVIKVPVATSTITSTCNSYTKTSLLQTNGITAHERRSPLDILNEPSTEVERSTPLDAVKKTTRPFKAYSRNSSLFLKRQTLCSELMSDNNYSNYLDFRQKMLNTRKMHENAPNPKMRRIAKNQESPGLPTSTADEKDAVYWQKRKKNNEAAKRSRDNRRAMEDELAIWASYLQTENNRLRSELRTLYYMLQQAGYDVNQIRYKNI